MDKFLPFFRFTNPFTCFLSILKPHWTRSRISVHWSRSYLNWTAPCEFMQVNLVTKQKKSGCSGINSPRCCLHPSCHPQAVRSPPWCGLLLWSSLPVLSHWRPRRTDSLPERQRRHLGLSTANARVGIQVRRFDGEVRKYIYLLMQRGRRSDSLSKVKYINERWTANPHI